MGKADNHHQVDIPANSAADAVPNPCRAARIGALFSLKCALMLLLTASLFVSAIFCFPLLHGRRSGFVTDDADALAAGIKASFVLEKPFSMLASHIGRLEYDIYGEIGIPNSKVSIVSMQSSNEANCTYVVFAVVPQPKHASISVPALSVLRSSFVGLSIKQLTLILTTPIFGQISRFEVLKFPGGITVLPAQSASIWEITKMLFNFTLNSAISVVEEDLQELKAQLKHGLNLRSYENVYVQMTNDRGSTVSPPVIIQASVLSDCGSRYLLPDRLKQLAQDIKGSHAENFGLNYTVFGKVKSVQLSSYLQQSIESPSPSPSPSPSSSKEVPYSVPSPSFSLYSPSVSPPLYAAGPEIGPKPPSQAPGPSIPDSVSPPRQRPCISSSLPPRPSPGVYPHPSTPTYNAPNRAMPPQYKPPAPTNQIYPPELSPLSPAVIFRPSPLQEKGNGKNPMPPVSASPDISPSTSNSASYYADKWTIGLLVVLMFYLRWLQ